MLKYIYLLASSSPGPSTSSVQQSKALVKFSKNWDIEAAYNNMTSAVETVLTAGDFPQLRRACIHKIKSLKSNLPHKLIPQILRTSCMNELLDMLAQSEYWNWFDTRLLEALTYASGSPEAIELLECFKRTFYPRKISEFIPYQLVKPFKEFTSLKDKFDKDPSEVTVYELLEHRYKIEYDVLDIDEGELVLSCIKTGCVELTWQIPRELVYRAYTSMKRKHDELSSLAIKSLVCEEADKYAGIPILWHGQEVGEVGPIEPLPEHVRQEPYSLPQGFQWVTLSSSNVEEVARSIRKCRYEMQSLTNEHVMQIVNYYMTYPNTRSEWQFGIQATGGKLVGTILATPKHIHIEKEIKVFIMASTACHTKYQNKRLNYMLVKELVRRANLYKINQLILFSFSNLFKPVTTIMLWTYEFNQPTSSQLPRSPRTPGWRRMTSEDVPSTLALINKWSSQFEIRQVINSEEEFAHNFLLQKDSHTYVVEDKSNNITDLVSYILPHCVNQPHAVILAVVSTQSPVKQLIIDALGVCTRENYAIKIVVIHQYNIESDILASLSFLPSGSLTYHFQNYRYHEISQAKFWTFGL